LLLFFDTCSAKRRRRITRGSGTRQRRETTTKT